jgi:hypothetical protein
MYVFIISLSFTKGKLEEGGQPQNCSFVGSAVASVFAKTLQLTE